ncbi:hypothetical protein ACOSP7_007705 [Xanthoceras sorbifolium]
MRGSGEIDGNRTRVERKDLRQRDARQRRDRLQWNKSRTNGPTTVETRQQDDDDGSGSGLSRTLSGVRPTKAGTAARC